MRKNTCSYADTVIAEARTLSAYLVEIERGKCGGDVDLAIHRASMLWGIEEGAIKSLRYRWRELHDVKASLLERLREAYETVYERQCRQAEIEREIEATISKATLSRGGAGGAQVGEADHKTVSSAPLEASNRSTLSRADEFAREAVAHVRD